MGKSLKDLIKKRKLNSLKKSKSKSDLTEEENASENKNETNGLPEVIDAEPVDAIPADSNQIQTAVENGMITEPPDVENTISDQAEPPPLDSGPGETLMENGISEEGATALKSESGDIPIGDIPNGDIPDGDIENGDISNGHIENLNTDEMEMIQDSEVPKEINEPTNLKPSTSMFNLLAIIKMKLGGHHNAQNSPVAQESNEIVPVHQVSKLDRTESRCSDVSVKSLLDVERDILEIEKERLTVEKERLGVERRRLELEEKRFARETPVTRF